MIKQLIKIARQAIFRQQTGLYATKHKARFIGQFVGCLKIRKTFIQTVTQRVIGPKVANTGE